MSHRPEKRDHCHKKCQKYSAYSDSSSSCGEPVCKKKCYKVCTIKCEQKRRDKKEWGHKVKCVDSWTEISGSDRLGKKSCHKKSEKCEKSHRHPKQCHRK